VTKTTPNGEPSLPDGALQRLGPTRWRCTGTIDGGLAFADDDRRIIACGRATQILDAESGMALVTINHRSRRPAVSQDGQSFATAYFRFQRWSLAGEELMVSEDLPSLPRCFAFMRRDEQLLAGTQEGDLVIVNSATGKIESSDRICLDRIEALAVTPNGQRALALTGEGRLLVRATAQLGARPKGWTGEDGIAAFALSPDGTKVALSPMSGNQLRIVATRTGETMHIIDHAHVARLSFTPDDELLVGRDWDDALVLWDWRKNGLVACIEIPDVGTSAFAISRDSHKLCAAAGASLLSWHLPDAVPLAGNEGPHGDMTLVAWSSDGDQIITANDDDCRIWNAGTGVEQHQLEPEERRAVHVSPRGTRMAWVSDEAVVLEQLASHQREQIGLDDNEQPSQLALSHHERLLAVGGSLFIEIRELPSGRKLHDLRIGGDRLDMVRFSADDTMVAASTREGRVWVWDVAGGKVRFKSHKPEEARCVAFSPDGRWLACDSGARNVYLWDLASGKLVAQLDGECSAGTRDLVFSPDGMLLAQLAWSRDVTLWDVENRDIVGRFDPSPDHSTAIGFSPDGTRLATGNESGVALIWDVLAADRRAPARALAQALCHALSRDDRDERRSQSVYRAAPKQHEHTSVWLDTSGTQVTVQDEVLLLTVAVGRRGDDLRLTLTVIERAAAATEMPHSWLARASRWWVARFSAEDRARRRRAEAQAETWREVARTEAKELGCANWHADIEGGRLVASFTVSSPPEADRLEQLVDAILHTS